MAADTGPGGCRRRVRDAVRAARLARGLTQQQAATALDWSLSKMARIETGAAGVSVCDLRALLGLYQVSDAETGPLIEMARAARTRPWFTRYPVAGTVPGLARYLDAETSASAISACRGLTLPGLLQTADYARAVLTGLGAARVDERVDLLLARQRLLDRDDCPDLRFILDEAALHQCCGGPAVMRAQLRQLTELASYPRISVRIVPFTAGAYPLAGTPYTIIEPPGQSAGEVYLETGSGTMACRPGRHETSRYLRYFAAADAKSAGSQASGLLDAADRAHATAARAAAPVPAASTRLATQRDQPVTA